jgi:CheY-like chemotaxis protein
LGLSLCYGIIAEHKGKIYAESKPGKGVTFIVELPVVEEFTSPEQAKMQFEPEKAIKGRILVVDDEQTVRDVVKRVLTKEGHKIETADDADEALKKIERKKYNLILVDIKMPGMNGVELFKRIRKIDKSLAGKVVFITGDIMSADTEKFLSETKVSHISKPFNAGQLKLEINRALSGEPLGQDK